MELVGGCQLQVPIMQVAPYSLVAQQQLEKQLYNVKLGAILAFLMEFHVFQNLSAHLIKHKWLVKTKELMEPVFGLHRQPQIAELADFSYVQMLSPILTLIQDVLPL